MEKDEASTSPRRASLGELSFIVAVLLAFSWLAVATWGTFSDHEVVGPLKAQEQKTVHVWIEGAVQFPGLYAFDKGAVLGDLLDQAVPRQEADLRRFKRTTLLQQGKKVVVPFKENISVYIAGEVSCPRWVQVPKGTRLCDLAQYLSSDLLHEIDRKPLGKQRYLKDGEVVVLYHLSERQGEGPR